VRSASQTYANFDQVLERAIEDFIQHGYDSEQRLTNWIALLRLAMYGESQARAEERLSAALRTIYERLVERGGILRHHPGVARWTVEMLKPRLRAELQRRVLANTNLIKLNREEAVATTLRRFAGWASSIPPGGTDQPQKREVKAQGRKAIAQERYRARLIQNDQGHKFTAALNEILAVDSGALAVRWNSHWRRPGYQFREEHKERDGLVYAIRGNWALERGLMTKGSNPYYDEIDGFGQAINCTCFGTWLSGLRRLPREMITPAGQEELARVSAAVAA
jgi:hypothetical protein